MIFFSLINTALSSIFYGVIVTAVITVILYVVLKSISPNIVKTPIFFVTGVVLSVLLIIQSSLMIGAIQAKGTVDSVEIYLSQLLENAYGTVGAQDCQEILDAVTEKFPVIGSYINIANFAGQNVENLATSMCETMKEYLSSYIWHRVWWIVGILFVACFIVMLFDKRNSTAYPPKTSGRIASRKNYDDF